MTLFEYITVAVSIVLSLSVVRMVDGIGPVFSSQRRYSVHSTWCAIKMFQPLVLWWSLWALRDVGSWTLLSFILAVAAPALIYMQISTLVPAQADRVTDWREHFYSTKGRFFGANLALGASGVALSLALGTFSQTPLILVGAGAEAILSIVALNSISHRVHTVVVGVTAFLFVCGAVVLYRVPTPAA